jgi:hypothetical protein
VEGVGDETETVRDVAHRDFDEEEKKINGEERQNLSRFFIIPGYSDDIEDNPFLSDRCTVVTQC